MKHVCPSLFDAFHELALVVLVGVSLVGCAQGQGASPAARPAVGRSPASLLSTTVAESLPGADQEQAVVEARPWPTTVRVQGSLRCDQRVVVGAKVAGRVKQVNVDLGDEVKPGDVLATLETEEFDLKVQQAEAQVEQVRAALGLGPSDDEKKLDPRKVPAVVQEEATWNEARSNWQRAQGLEGVITKEEIDQRKATLDVAAARYQAALHNVEESAALLRVRQAELGLARQALADAQIRAPFHAIVEERLVNPGAYLQVGEAVASLMKIDPLRFRAGVPELEAARLELGQPVAVFLDGRQDLLEAAITRISPTLDLASRSLAIEADLPNPDLSLRSGIFAEAEIVVDPGAKALAVPAEAVTEFAGVEKVRVLRNGRPEEQPVDTGRRGRPIARPHPQAGPGQVIRTIRNDEPLRPGDVVEILKGVLAGERVVYRKEE